MRGLHRQLSCFPTIGCGTQKEGEHSFFAEGGRRDTLTRKIRYREQDRRGSAECDERACNLRTGYVCCMDEGKLGLCWGFSGEGLFTGRRLVGRHKMDGGGPIAADKNYPKELRVAQGTTKARSGLGASCDASGIGLSSDAYALETAETGTMHMALLTVKRGQFFLSVVVDMTRTNVGLRSVRGRVGESSLSRRGWGGESKEASV